MKLEMTPMIDVTFLLLVFFMVTMSFAQLEGRLPQRLPQQGKANKSSDMEKEVTVRIRLIDVRPRALLQRVRTEQSLGGLLGGVVAPESRFKMALVVGSEEVLEMVQQAQGVGQHHLTTVRLCSRGLELRTARRLVERLRRIRLSNPELKVKIKPDRAATYAAVVLVLDSALSAGFDPSQIRFASKTRPD